MYEKNSRGSATNNFNSFSLKNDKKYKILFTHIKQLQEFCDVLSILMQIGLLKTASLRQEFNADFADFTKVGVEYIMGVTKN